MTEPFEEHELAITAWIDGLRHAEPEAAEQIWQHYFQKLVLLAKQRLGNLPRRVSDEEDVALSALNSVILGIQSQKFPALCDRDDLWKLLVVVTSRKAVKQQRRHFATKRPDHKIVDHTDVSGSDCAISLLRNEPSPESAAQFAEELQRLLLQLPTDDIRSVALLRLDGYTNREIADKLNWYEGKVERRMRIIRKLWINEVESSHDNSNHS